MTVFSSGISLHALARMMELLLGWNYHAGIAISALIVLVYIFLGGLTSAIYNEVLQFFMIVMGFAPLVFLALKDVGGWGALKEKLILVATSQGYAAGTWTDSWAHMGSTIANPMGVEWIGMVMGLGFVLSFGYWCTDFLVVQRAMAANRAGENSKTDSRLSHTRRKICGPPALDRQFKTIDFLTLLDLETMPPLARQRFLS